MAMDTTLTLGMPGASSPCSRGSKRKCDAANGSSVSGISLELALGQFSSVSSDGMSTSATGCIEEDASVNECLVFSHPSNHLSAKKPALDANPIMPSENILLSFLQGASTSFVTQASFFQQQGSTLDASASVNLPMHFDEGSTSSRWKPGRTLLSFSAGEAAEHPAYETILPDAVMINSSNATMKSTACTSGINKTRRGSGTKVCQFQGCAKGARGASGLCIAHGGGRRCKREGCRKGAEGGTIFCKAHGGGRRCQYLGCTKSAEGRTDYCIGHGGGRRCGHEGCSRAARGKSGLCIKHGGGKRCRREGCMRSAEGLSGLCISHGGGRRCKFPNCPKGAQGSTMFCKAHGGGKRCTVVGCGKGAEGSTPFCKAHGGGKRCAFQGGSVCTKSVHGGTLFCVAHGGGKRCAQLGCGRSARGRTDFCVRHGGGKRCKADGCGKSAQGRTDFCKAHGGGTRCSWGKPGSGNTLCNKFARGRTGLCAFHTALVQQDHRMHGAGPRGWIGFQDANLSTYDKGNLFAAVDIFPESDHINKQSVGGGDNFTSMHSDAFSLPEGRVHGGRLMEMLANGAGRMNQVGSIDSADTSGWLGVGHSTLREEI